MPSSNSADSRKVGSLCELMILEQQFDKHGKLIVNPKIDRNDGTDDPEFSEHALVHRRIFNKSHQLVESKLDINSPQILKALQTVVKYYPAHPVYFDEPLTIDGPYMLLCHHWAELEEYRANTTDDEARMHMNFLLSFMEREMGTDKKKADRLIAVKYISFALLWTIFKPGAIIAADPSTSQGQGQLYRLHSLAYDQDEEGRYLELHICSTAYDGHITGRHNIAVELREGDVGKATAIKDMKYYPLEYVDNPDKLLERMQARGERFLELRGIHVKRYKGQLQCLREPPLGFFSHNRSHYAGVLTPKNVEGRIIIDTKTFMEENPTYDPVIYDYDIRRHAEELHMGPKHTYVFWNPHDPALCPPFVYGFSPSLKQWCQFNIDNIGEPKWAEDAFDKLILNPAPKRVIKSLVSAHEFPDGAARDQQELKGKGLVMLLHGTPGTGKTLTAEAVAEHTKSPLLVISSGELGVEVGEIDSSLTKFLQYAAMWKAIVLIDEADVFLEARLTGVSNRLEQNSLVAVFLRQFEYFQGVVFLTSNRGSGLDPAIKSRIHLFLQFSPPDRKTRRIMWEQALRKFPESEMDIDMTEALDVLSVPEMNGREISNGSHLIKTLAREEGTKVSNSHLMTFLQVWECFEGAEVEGQGIIGRGGKKMRNAKLGTVCETCGCACKDTVGIVRRGSIL